MTAYGMIDTWDVSKVEDLGYIFCSVSGPYAAELGCNVACKQFNDDVSSWDTAKVTSLDVRHRARSDRQALFTGIACA